jgi:thiamine pyrophosphate-dependent acetolactate synthase large subunit-like protein
MAAMGKGTNEFVCQIVGGEYFVLFKHQLMCIDGTFLFSVPGSVYWIARRYKIPTLTVVLNNHGWHAPRNSLMLVHPNGYGSKVSNADLHLSFDPSPDYAGIAEAAAGGPEHLWAVRVGDATQLVEVIQQAVEKVKGGMSVVIDAHLNGSEGKVLK